MTQAIACKFLQNFIKDVPFKVDTILKIHTIKLYHYGTQSNIYAIIHKIDLRK